ncbi:MAG: hypothetical protein IPK80_23900 [Nannocystis sp.]|nr:hypothetical protein [Nannocystis sp.]
MILSAVALCTLLAACSGDDGATGATTGEESSTTADTSTSGATTSTTSGSTSAGTEGETSSTSSTTGDPSTSSGSTTDDPTTTTDATTGTTDATTGGEVDGMKSCEIACENLAGCVGVPPEACVADCMDDFSMADSDGCAAAKIALNVCLGTLTCENIENEDFGECGALATAADEACGGGVDPVCVGSKMMMGPGCTHSFDCGDVVYAMKCNNQGCQCLVDDVVDGGCQNMGYCPLEGDEAAAAAAACCGFEL